VATNLIVFPIPIHVPLSLYLFPPLPIRPGTPAHRAGILRLEPLAQGRGPKQMIATGKLRHIVPFLEWL